MTSETKHNSTEPVAIFKKRGRPNFRKQAPREPSLSDSDSDNESDDDVEHNLKRQKRKKGTVITSLKAKDTASIDIQPTKFIAERTNTIKSSNDATKSSEWFDENAVDKVSDKNLLGSTRAIPTDQPDGNYKGLTNRTTFIAKNPNAPKRVVGPIKAPTNLRTVTVTDFAPDVCKDYKQTGFCGFGDSCKYLHAREDYKHGWQLDKEWENVTKGKKIMEGVTIASADRKVENDESDDDSILENIPFACILCKERYQNPIVTKCRHYFCEACALKRYRKHQSCAACGASTGGVFNVAKSLKKLLERKKDKALKKREKALQNGEQVSDDEISDQDI